MRAPKAKGPPLADAKGDPKGLLTFPDEAILSRTFINRAQDFSRSLAAFIAALDLAVLAIVVAVMIGAAI